MDGANLIRIARARAGLTQAQLASRAGVPRESIARWETGAREPSLKTVERLVAAAGFELDITITEGDSSLRDQVQEQLDLPPTDRVRALLPRDDLGGAIKALEWLSGQDVGAIVIGPMAGALQGAPQRPGTSTVEIVPSDQIALAVGLEGDGFTPVDSPERWAAEDRRWPWSRDGSIVSIATMLPGSAGYADLRRSSEELRIGDDHTVDVAAPRDLVRLAEASSRATERARIPGLRALLEERS